MKKIKKGTGKAKKPTQKKKRLTITLDSDSIKNLEKIKKHAEKMVKHPVSNNDLINIAIQSMYIITH